MPFTMQQYGEFVTRRPFLVIVLSLLLTMVALAGGQHLRFTNDYRYFFSNENPYLTAFEELERTYSSPDTIFYVYQPKDGTDATTEEALNLAYELTEAGWQVPYSTRVDSLTNFQNTRAIGEDDLEVRDLLPDPSIIDGQRIAYIEETILNEPLLAGRLLSLDKKTAAVLVSLRPPVDDTVATNEIVVKARAIHEEMRAKYPNIRIELTGSQMLSNAFSEAAQGDLATLTPTMFVMPGIDCDTRKFSHQRGDDRRHPIGRHGDGHRRLACRFRLRLRRTDLILTVAVADCVHILITALVAQGAA